MEDSGVQETIRRAKELLARKEPDDALDLLEEELERSPDAAKLYELRGIALAQLGRVDEATISLRRATMLDPTDPETFYNLAVQLFDEGDHLEAAVAAREALKLDPNHSGAAETLAKSEAQAGEAPFEADGQLLPPDPKSIRRGMDDGGVHTLGLGPQWTAVGYAVLAICLASTLLLVFHSPFQSNWTLKHDSLSVLAVFCYVFQGLLAVVWMLCDIVDRRERLLWLLPIWICGFSALPVLPLGLYIYVSRNQIHEG